MGKRVCIFDWDIHHGDGTQKSFYEQEDVLYISYTADSRVTLGT